MRAVSTRDFLLRVNGTPLTVRGANRREHCPEGGKAIKWESMVTDAKLMKQFNFNAVRTSHYPNCQHWYELWHSACTWWTRRTLRLTASRLRVMRALLPRRHHGATPSWNSYAAWCAATRTMRASWRGVWATSAATGQRMGRWLTGVVPTSRLVRAVRVVRRRAVLLTSSAQCTRRGLCEERWTWSQGSVPCRTAARCATGRARLIQTRRDHWYSVSMRTRWATLVAISTSGGRLSTR